MATDLRFFRLLQRHGVPFVIVGGHAVNYYGYPRGTEDSDLVWMRTPQSEIDLLKALEEVRACRLGREIDPATGIEKLHPSGAAHP